MADPLPTPTERYALLLVDRYGQGRETIWEGLRRFIARLLTGMSAQDLRDAKAQAEAAAKVAAALRTAQRSLGGLTQSYLDETTRLTGAKVRSRRAQVERDPRGVPAEKEWLRPFDAFLDAIDKGRDEEQARLKMLERAEVMSNDDLAIVMRKDAEDHMLANGQKVIGYRRVLHPELSTTGACGLCIVASDRLYTSDRLMPLHGRCRCGVIPVTTEWDIGDSLNNLTLADLYEAAGDSGLAEELKKTRYKIVEHSELGPRLHQTKGTTADQLTPYEAVSEPATDSPATGAEQPAAA